MRTLRLFRRGPARKHCLSRVVALCCLPGAVLVVGGAEGRLLALDTGRTDFRGRLLPLAETRLPDGITSVALGPSDSQLRVATTSSDLFRITLDRQVSALLSVIMLVQREQCLLSVQAMVTLTARMYSWGLQSG
jgi:hypothetical protein